MPHKLHENGMVVLLGFFWQKISLYLHRFQLCWGNQAVIETCNRYKTWLAWGFFLLKLFASYLSLVVWQCNFLFHRRCILFILLTKSMTSSTEFVLLSQWSNISGGLWPISITVFDLRLLFFTNICCCTSLFIDWPSNDIWKGARPLTYV